MYSKPIRCLTKGGIRVGPSRSTLAKESKILLMSRSSPDAGLVGVRDVLLGDEVHAVAQRRHERDVGCFAARDSTPRT